MFPTAGRADVAIVIVGLIGDNTFSSMHGQAQEGEVHDRATVALPWAQMKLLKAVVRPAQP